MVQSQNSHLPKSLPNLTQRTGETPRSSEPYEMVARSGSSGFLGMVLRKIGTAKEMDTTGQFQVLFPGYFQWTELGDLLDIQ